MPIAGLIAGKLFQVVWHSPSLRNNAVSLLANGGWGKLRREQDGGRRRRRERKEKLETKKKKKVVWVAAYRSSPERNGILADVRSSWLQGDL